MMLNRSTVFICMFCVALVLSGCETMPRSVVAATGTNIGLEVSQNPATQVPQMKLGYNRAEVAFVSETEYDGDVANVLMELRYGGKSEAHPGIYQRLAVGKTAVRMPGAAALFIKNAQGDLDRESIEGLKAAVTAFDPDKFDED